MNPAAIKAAVLMVAGLVLLLPAFNTINASHIEGVDPPADIPPPPTLPSHLPPPPSNAPKPKTSPNGTHDMPTCPPAEPQEVYHASFDATNGNANPGDTKAITVAPGMALIGGGVRYSGYTGGLSFTLTDPSGHIAGSATNSATSVAPPRSDEDHFSKESPAPGRWSVSWSAQPILGGGIISIQVLPVCGAAHHG